MRLGTILGTTIDAEITFLILMAFFVITAYNPSRGWHYALLWIPVVVISVVLHELAHAAMIGLFGFGPSRIILGGMGGVTINDRQQTKPWQQVVISVAGPLTSFGLWYIATLLYLHFRVFQ